MIHSRQHVFTGGLPSEEDGVCRAVRDGRFIAVTGTAPLDSDGKTVGKGDAATQARRCIRRSSIGSQGIGLGSSGCHPHAHLFNAHRGLANGSGRPRWFFRGIHPATTVVQVVSFIDPDWLIEVEADAIAAADES